MDATGGPSRARAPPGGDGVSAPPLDLDVPMTRSRRFWSLLGAQSLGSFADNALRAAAIIAIAGAWRAGIGEGGDFHMPDWLAAEAGTYVGLCFTVPIVLFSMISGQVADRYDRHVVLRATKVVEVVLMLVAAAFFAMGNAYGLLLFLFFMGMQSAFLAPTRAAMMPHFFPGRELMRATGWFQGTSLIAIVLGLGAGGALIGLGSGRTVVSVILVTAAALGLFCAYRSPASPSPGLNRINWNVATQSVRMYRDTWRMPGVFWPMIGMGWFWGVGAIVLANLENFVAAVGGGAGANPSDNLDFTVFQVLFAVGTGVGSVAAGVIASKMRDPMLMSGIGLAGTIICSLLIVVISLSIAPEPGTPAVRLVENATPAVLALGATIVATAVANGLFAVPLITAVQSRAPEGERARVLGTQNMTNGLGATLMGLLVPPSRLIGLTPITLFAGLAALQCLVLAFMWHRRTTYGRVAVTGPDAEARPARAA